MRAACAAFAIFLGLSGGAFGGSAFAMETAPVKLAIVVPIVVPSNTTGLVSADTLALYTAPLGLLSRQLDAIIDRPVTIAIDPMIIVSIRVLGSAAPPSATAWLERVARATNESLALPYANSDLTLATQAGSASVLGPERFEFAIDPALFAAPTDETGTPTPTPTPTPGVVVIPKLPTSDELVQWPYTFPNLGWPRANSVIADDLEPLKRSFDSVILASENVSIAAGSASVAAVGGIRAIVADGAVSTTLASATAAASNDSWLDALAQLTSATERAGLGQSDSPVVVATLDPLTALGGTRLAETLSVLSSTQGVVLVPLSTVVTGSRVEATLVDQPQPAARVATMRSLLEARDAERDFASILEFPEVLTAPRSLEVTALSSSSWLATTTGLAVATQNFLDESSQIVSSVQVVQSSSFNLLADNATLPIVVSNDLDFEVTVYITVRPRTALLAVGDSRVEVLVEPNAQAKGQVPVTAISNGTVRAIVTLSSQSDVAIGAPTVAKINVQAGWETPIVVVGAGLVIAIFALGIVRTVLRRRNAEPIND